MSLLETLGSPFQFEFMLYALAISLLVAVPMLVCRDACPC